MPLCVRLDGTAGRTRASVLTQLSAEGAAQLMSAVFLDLGLFGVLFCFFFPPFRSSVSPFRVTAPEDMAICSQVITVARFESTILSLLKGTFSFVTTEHHLMRIKSEECCCIFVFQD